MKIVIEDLKVGEEIKISCKENSSQEIKYEGSNFKDALKAIRDSDEDTDYRIKAFIEEMEARVEEEIEYINQTANPEKTKQWYISNICWKSARLAEYIKSKFL